MDKSRRYKIARAFALIQLRYARGNTVFNFVSDIFKFGAYAGMYKLAWDIPDWLTKVMAMGIITGFIIYGIIDEKWFGAWQMANDYTYRDLNPFFKELDEKINRIEKKINGKGKEDSYKIDIRKG